MLPSLRLAIYFGLGALLWATALAHRGFLTLAVFYDVLLLAAAVLDWLLSPRPQDFEIERRVEPKMNLGVPNRVTLHARNRGRWPVRLTVRDEPPLDWPVVVPDGGVALAPQSSFPVPAVARLALAVPSLQETDGFYSVTPTRRGDFAFGALSARYPTLLGLWHRQFRRDAKQTVRVYPDTTAVRGYELSLREGRLRTIGIHLSRLRGRGTDFESLRDYTTDDEYKNINWKATARRGKLISTNYQIERDQTIVIALDCGRMMTAMAVMRERALRESTPSEATGSAVSTVPLSKLDCAINATVLLAHVAASMGDAVGFLLFADTVQSFVPPRKGRIQTGTIIEALYAAQPSLVEPDYASAYEYLIARKIRRSLVLTFTDLIDPDASHELLAASGALRRHHNALCVTINNRDVMDLAEMMPQSADELYQKAMAQRMLSQRAAALEALHQRGVGILDVPAAQLTIATVNRYLDLKSRGVL